MSLHRRNIRSALLGATALAGALSLAVDPAAAQQRQQAYNFDLPAQPLASALRAYGATADQQLIFADADVRGRTAPALKGNYTPEDALNLLLAGANLTVHRTASGVVQIASASDPQSGSAAGDGADSGTVQALVVTAQKREENIQDVPIAMSAFTQEDLTRSQVAGGPDLMTQVPNFTFTKTNFSGYSIQIRGIGTQAISATTDPAVAVAFNNTPFVRNRFFEQEFYDLQRVEVLRGPQGTLYGRNATAGVVNLISAKPTFRYEAKASADVSNYSSRRLEGMINLPLVDDTLAFRLAGAWTNRDGYADNQLTGRPIDGRNLWSWRASLRFEPTEQLHANFIWEHFGENDDRLRSGKQLCRKDPGPSEIGGVPVPHSDVQAFGTAEAFVSQGCLPVSLYSPEAFETPNGPSLPYYVGLGAIGTPVAFTDPYASTTQSRNLRIIESSRDPNYKAKSDLAEIQVSFDLGHNLTLSSETAYSSDFVFSTQDFNRFNTKPGAFFPSQRPGEVDANGVFCDPQIGCTDRLAAVDLSTARSRQFSQEFRLSSDFDGRFNFSVGANYLRYDTNEKYYLFINSLTLLAADRSGHNNDIPYGPGSDNSQCLPFGELPGAPDRGYWILGCIYIDPNPIGHLNDEGHNYFLSKNPYRLISYAAFGEAYYNFTPALKLTAGLRWTVDKKHAPEIPSWLVAGDTYGYPVSKIIDQKWSKPTGRVTLDWKPNLGFTGETLVYGSLSHGYKAGGANPPPAVVATYSLNFQPAFASYLATQPRTFKPEYVNAAEVGTKNTLADGRLTLNLASFYYDYKGYQISEIVNRSALNFNFDAKIWGVELEASWRLVENLNVGLKLGYEHARMANGSRAIDLIDRTAGDPNYIVLRPIPGVPSNCIVPVWFASFGGHLTRNIGSSGVGVSENGPCVDAYIYGLDPATGKTYVPNPVDNPLGPDYPGFNPADVPNNGEGIFKDLSGHELPNAPHYTATLTADYTLPLTRDWLVTLHSDLYYQSEAWTRIFNTPGYDKLKAYNNLNVAAIFNNEDAGWQVMAYVKNAFDRTAITGAFLNSDDTGLTTNVFLNEPRLYGLRVTKRWNGEPMGWTGAHHGADEPYPLTVELGGSVLRTDAPNGTFRPDFVDLFAVPGLPVPLSAQSHALDWGDGREVRIIYNPSGARWSVIGGFKHAEANGTAKALTKKLMKGGRLFDDQLLADYPILKPYDKYINGLPNYAQSKATHREEHTIVDFEVGHEVGLGALGRSRVAAGLRYAHFKSSSSEQVGGIPDIPDAAAQNLFKYNFGTFHRYTGSFDTSRQFQGAGPSLALAMSKTVLGGMGTGRVSVDADLGGSILFGRQRMSSKEQETQITSYLRRVSLYAHPISTNVTEPVQLSRSRAVTVPNLDASLGLSYQIDRFKVSTGYRWERYFNVLDAGVDQHKSYDRTIDGPYFKISVGFGD